ncbi:MAG: ATP-binding cassette domain-containing protein, partial [Legionella sp.]|nr:ATP-binding cassette domain-containing protein [Legionella sp.]
GKSTLLNTLLGLLRPTSGNVHILGEDLTQISQVEKTLLRRKIGVAFQGGALFGSLNVLENIMLPLREHTKLDANTMRIMARLKMQVVNLSGFEHLMPSELSGGMIKRAAFARAVVMDPRILFCDEPSAGLDPIVASAIDDLILNLRDAMGMSVVVVTHELESAFRIADRICVLDKGDILMTGTVDEIRSSDNERIQNLLNRRTETETLDPEEYLKRLTAAND